jgi:ABC-2 type transport system ATP-binding protein
MNDDVAVQINSVSKSFKLPHEKKTSVKSIFTDLFSPKGKATKQQALKNINFEIKKGEFFGIVGRNGSGKSTLLKIIAGIYQPTKGTVQVNGKLVPFIELGVGFNPELTGRENVYLNGAILGFSNKKIDENYSKIVEFAELEEFMDQKLKNYSSGMQVRLAFACATMAEAEVLLVDEVLAVGDTDFQKKCFNFFKHLKKIKKTVVFVTHDMNAVREYCDRAVLINDSKLEVIGSPSEVSNSYSKLFIKESAESDETLSDNRQGTGRVKIVKIEPIRPLNSKSSLIKIKIFFKFYENIEGLIVGFKIKDAADFPVLGTNSKIENIKIPNTAKGSKGSAEFVFNNILNNGTYSLELQLVGETGEVYDWIIDAKKIIVNTEKQTGYIVEPDFKARYKNEQ